MRPLSKRKKNRILKRLFSGETYEQAAREEDVAKSSAKVVYDEFVGRAADSSLEEAAAEYEVPEEIGILRELAVESKKADLSTHELLSAARMSALMKHLDLNPVELQDHLELYKKHTQEFGDFAKAALKLKRLEEESGKKYDALIADYEETTRRLGNMRDEEKKLGLKIQSLNKECQDKAKKIKNLDEKGKTAQAILDRLHGTKHELAEYGLKIGDLATVKTFLHEIRRLRGDPTKAIEILSKTKTLEDNLAQRKKEQGELERSFDLRRGEMSLEEQKNKKTIELLEIIVNGKHEEIRQLKVEVDEARQRKDDTLHQLNTEVDEAKQKSNGIIHQLKEDQDKERKNLSNLKEQNKNFGLLIDGLRKQQAAILGVQPDIDEIAKALPARKKELEQTETKIKENEAIVKAAEAVAALLAKKPPDRDAIIRFLQLTRHDATYSPNDDSARRRIVESIMAEQGFVPKGDLERAEKDAEERIKQFDGQTATWKGIARRRLENLEAFQNQLQALRKEQEGKWDKSITEKLSNLAVEVVERVSLERAENPQ